MSLLPCLQRRNDKSCLALFFGIGDCMYVKLIDATTQKQIYSKKYDEKNFLKRFISDLPKTFGKKLKVVILQFFGFNNHNFKSSIDLYTVFRTKLNGLNILHYFSSTTQYLYGPLIMEGNITLNIGDTLMVGRIAPTSIGFYDFEYTEEGYRKLDYYMVNVSNQQIAAKQIIELCKSRKKVIIEDFSEYGYIKFLKSTLKLDNLIFVERDLNLIKFTVEMSKWFFDKSYIKFFIIPTTLGNYCIMNNAADNLLSIELDELLPISRECIIPKSVNVVLLCEKGIFQPHYASHKMEIKCHRNKIILSVDGESFPTIHTEPILLPQIVSLPSKLTENVNSKIPIIGFCDNFSVICCYKDDKNGFQFIDEWNGVFGTELVINFCFEKPVFGEKALSSSKETISYEFEQNEKLFTFENPKKPIFNNSKQKPFHHSNEIYSYEPGYLVYDIIKIMSMPDGNIKIEDSWTFKITKDEEHPVLLEFMNDKNELKLAAPEFLMAMLLRQHIKVIKKEIGEKPAKLGFCILDDDNYGIEEIERIQNGLKEACDLLKIGFEFVNV